MAVQTFDAHLITPRRDWRAGLPPLSDGGIRLRELVPADAGALLLRLNDPATVQHIAPCPSDLEGFHRFIAWTHRERERGMHACYGLIPPGETSPAGVIQIWPVERDMSTAEWGFVVARAYWGTGLFINAARLFLDSIFVEGLFGPPGVYRLESRAATQNGRGNSVLRNLGATMEGVLRGAFHDHGSIADHAMWSILAPEWLAARAPRDELV